MRVRTTIAALAIILASGAPARPDTVVNINFDDLFPRTPVVDQYATWGIRFATQLLDTQANIVIASAALSQSPPNVLASSSSPYIDGVISFSFLPAATAVSFTAVSVEDGVTVTYLDLQGLPLFVDAQPGAPAFQTPVPFSYSNNLSPIGAVVIVAQDGSTPDSFAIDDVMFNLIPEPASLLLLASGLAFLSRRRNLRFS